MWTKEALHELIATKMRDHRLIVVANREPYIHRYVDGRIQCLFPASGMASAIDPIMRACRGTWVAHGSGDADRVVVDAKDHIRVPPDNPTYNLRRVWLTKAQEQGYYYGLSNEALWPLCHIVFTRPKFEPTAWESYREVNQLFARTVLQEIDQQPTIVFIQDYHFALLPLYLKQANPNLIVAQFWHIPWPNREAFRAFPWKQELLDGLLANDLLGFHLNYHCQNFLDTADRALEVRVDHEHSTITRGGHATAVRPFPISIDFKAQSAAAQSQQVAVEVARWKNWLKLSKDAIGIGIDRIDYTKGIPDRLRALDHCFEMHPEHRERFTFVQVGVPSRSSITQYQSLDHEIDQLVDRINSRWQTDTWRPIVYLKQHVNQTELIALHQLARFCIVSSLHDGMNLVAKEFVASRTDDDGVLILSQFTGAARELTDALLVNPFSIVEIANAIHQAIEMPREQRRRRMQKMRSAVEENNIYRWAGKLISTLLKLDPPEPSPQPSQNFLRRVVRRDALR